jgi:hypothetical protein
MSNVQIAGAVFLFTAVVLSMALAGRPGPNDPPGARATTGGQVALAIVGFAGATVALAIALVN